MSTVLEIEKAIEALPLEQRREVREWLEEYDGLTSSAASTFALYDQEEGDAQQWED